MPRRITYSLKIIIILITFLFLLGCDLIDFTNGGLNKKQKPYNGEYTDLEPNKNKIKYDIYSDTNKQINIDGVNFDFTSITCNDADPNYSLYVNIVLTNWQSFEVECKVSDVYLLRETTGSFFKVNYHSNFTLEGPDYSFYSFTATIPSSIENDNYKLFFKFNDIDVNCYLYEKPDSLRDNRTVKYYISNNLVKTEIVKDGRMVENGALYETSDNLSYCDTWYIDSKTGSSFDSTKPVTSDLNLYGTLNTFFYFATSGSDTYSYILSINRIPSNKVLIIPEYYSNKRVAISSLALREIKAEKLYIPKTLASIGTGNFKSISGLKIYYEGSKEEWESLKIGASTPPIKTKDGWLMTYHGVSAKDFNYRVGVALLDLSDPTHILYRTKDFIFEPEEKFETDGYYNGCVFPTGIVERNGKLFIYYGAGDKCIGVATCQLDELLSYLKEEQK